MDYLIDPVMPGTPNTKGNCTCFMGSNNACQYGCIVHDVCGSRCLADCTLLVCGRGVARRITQ